MGHLIGLWSKHYEITSSSKIIYIVLQLHCSTQPYKIIQVYMFYTYIVLHNLK
jgi:hypothetical protein